MIENDDLHKHLTFYRQIFNSVQQAVIVTDKNAKIILWNNFAEKLYGYTSEEAIGKTTIQIISPENIIENHIESIEQLKKGIISTSEYLVKNKNGKKFPVKVNISPLLNSNNETIAFIGISEDITEQKEKEKLLLQSEEKYRSLFETAEDAVFLADVETGILTDVNKYGENLIGYNRDEIIGQHYTFLHPKDENLLYTKNFEKAKVSKGELFTDMFFLHKNGALIPIEGKSGGIISLDGKKFHFSIFRDISERKKYENELIAAKEKAVESEEKYKQIFDNTLDIIFILEVTPDIRFKFSTYNSSEAKLMGDFEKYRNKYIEECFVPEISKPMIENYKRCLHEEKLIVYEEQVFWNDKMNYFQTQLIPLRNNEGRFHRIIGISRNITENRELTNLLTKQNTHLIRAKKKAEESEESHRILLDTMFEGVTLNELIFNEQGDVIDYRILDVNSAFNNHSHIKREDLIGKLATEVFKMSPEYIKQFWRLNLDKKTLITTDYYSESADTWQRINTSPPKNGKFTITFFDITEQKKAEQLIEKKSAEVELNNARLESLLRISQYQTNSIQELLDFALEEAIRLTQSKIGYIYRYNEENKQFTINTWSKDVIKECSSANQQTFYNLDESGYWGEAVRQRKPVIINNYQEVNPIKRGTPEVHGKLEKLLTIPVIINNEIVAVAGVANKEADYDKADIRQLSLLMDSVWKISERIILIKDLTLAKEKAEESELKVRNMFENTQIGILFCNTEGEILEANPAILDIIGSPSLEESLKINLLTFKPLQEIGFSQNVAKCISEKIIITEDVLYSSKWGKTVFMKYYLVPVIVSNKVIGVWANLNNLTDLWNTQNELIKAKEKAEESDLLKTAFLNNISHEIRTPLNSIVGFSKLAVKPNQQPEKIIDFSRIISNSSEQLINIITDVIDISHIQSNQVVTKISAVSCCSIIKSIAEKYEKIASEKGLTFEYIFKCEKAKCIINTDVEKLSKIIKHLLDNAIKFTIQGSVKYTCYIENDRLHISISDTGIGISEDMQKVMFEPFRQAETGLSRDFGGTGLGLSLIKAYVDLLKGSIQVNSEMNKGSEFLVSIPLSSESVINNLRSLGNKRPSTINVLIAEDEFSSFEYLKELISDLGFNTIHALNGQQAIDLCRNDNAIDLVLMDIKMPVIDGLTATKQIKLIRPDLPVIAQTAYATESEKASFINNFDDYLTKPINEFELKEKLLKFIKM